MIYTIIIYFLFIWFANLIVFFISSWSEWDIFYHSMQKQILHVWQNNDNPLSFLILVAHKWIPHFALALGIVGKWQRVRVGGLLKAPHNFKAVLVQNDILPDDDVDNYREDTIDTWLHMMPVARHLFFLITKSLGVNCVSYFCSMYVGVIEYIAVTFQNSYCDRKSLQEIPSFKFTRTYVYNMFIC